MKRHCPGSVTRRQFVRTAGALLGGYSAALVAGCAKSQVQPPEQPPMAAPAGEDVPDLGMLDGRESVARAVAMAGADADGGPKVAVARSPRMWSDEHGVDPEVMATVIDGAMMWFTGTDSAEKAWGSLFNSDEKVGLKPNGLGGMELATAQALSGHVVDRLTGIGVRRENIIIWEQNAPFIANCGIPLDDVPWGVQAVLTSDTLGQRIQQGTIDQRLTGVVTQQVDAIVNLPILKTHEMSGVTLSMKNHYGTIEEPWAYHWNFHENISDLASIPAIKDKTRLILCDMTHCIVDGGPSGLPHFFPGAVMVTNDMVAHDALGVAIIEEERRERGLPSLADWGKEVTYLQAAQERGVGVADMARIDARLMNFA
jgi:hypothetical protein